jgi:hypothetical protein
MFDESFDLSRTYFATIQTLRLASNMIDEVVQHWEQLRQQWDAIIAPSGMFSPQDLAAASANWDTVTRVLEMRAQRVQANIKRRSEDVKSLRDGVCPLQVLSTSGAVLGCRVLICI